MDYGEYKLIKPFICTGLKRVRSWLNAGWKILYAGSYRRAGETWMTISVVFGRKDGVNEMVPGRRCA